MFSRVWRDFLLFYNIIGILTTVEVSFNQPRFRPNATWNSNATNFANETLIFINSNNSIYIPNQKTNEILIWNNDKLSKKIPSSLSNPSSIFVTNNGDIYVGNEVNHGRIDKWIRENETWISVMNVTSYCYGLFVDIYENLYCSVYYNHRVEEKWSNGITTIVAGIGVGGSESDMLNHPKGIFVDINLDLYVADGGNHRIQLFRLNQREGITVAGNGSVKLTIDLNQPTDVVLDGGQHLFIVDSGNHRIIGSDVNGFRCIFGCSGYGSTNDKLSNPHTMLFDSYGNIYVIDFGNDPIQKISLSKKSDRNYENYSIFSLSRKSFHLFIVLTLSYNQPRFYLDTIWNSNATTFANRSFLGIYPSSIFVNSNNSIYILNGITLAIHIWLNENHLNPTKTIESNLSYSFSLFVTTNGDIYVDNGNTHGRIDKWIRENETWISVMNVTSACLGLFVDIYESLYCSLLNNHRVDKKWSNGTTTIVAGTGVRGSESDMLNHPWGIFVDINLDLYVADHYNHRIQLFRLNQRNGITVAGKESSKLTLELYQPSGIVLDGDRYLFIVDSGNHRIIGSDENGFRCIFGCSGQGSTNDKLSHPRTMTFDSYGNIYVTDTENLRIQKIIKNNICGKKFYLITFKEQTELIFSHIQ